jgi:glutamine synthetase
MPVSITWQASVEFHVFKLDNLRPPPTPLAAGARDQHALQGYQYLTETRFDQIEPILSMRRSVMACRCARSVEPGPSQCEFTFHPQIGLRLPTP